MTDTYTFPDGEYIPIEQYRYIENCIRKQVVQELEKLLCINDGWDHCIGVNQEHCDDVKECIDIVRGKPSD